MYEADPVLEFACIYELRQHLVQKESITVTRTSAKMTIKKERQSNGMTMISTQAKTISASLVYIKE